MKFFLRGLASRIIELLVRMTPKNKHVVIYGFPTHEGNAVETLKALGARYPGRIYWLDGPPVQTDSTIRAANNIRPLKRLSPAALAAYLTAEVVFFTHGLYGNPSPSGRQTIVNLWHGDGIKAHHQVVASKRSIAPATYVVGGTALLTERKAIDFRMSQDAVILSGNPRIDQFRRTPTSGALRLLGISPDRPFVIWMPTFRTARQVGVTPGWSDSGGAATDLAEQMSAFAEIFSARDVQLVVKPHPLDAESRKVAGCTIISDAQLAEAGASLYQLLGASAGLISDYSSVWTDYLILNKPIAFFIPDKEEYIGGRGLYPADALGWLPGRELKDVSSASEFVDEILTGTPSSASLRSEAANYLGLVRPKNSSAHDLLDRLEELGAFRLSRLKPRTWQTRTGG